MQQRAELEVAPAVGVEAEAIADGEREFDDVAAVLAGVAVVVLDDVAEDERHPLVGAVELDEALDARARSRANTASTPSSGSSARALQADSSRAQTTSRPTGVSAASMP